MKNLNIIIRKRKVSFVLIRENGKNKIIKQEEKPIIERAENGYRIKR